MSVDLRCVKCKKTTVHLNLVENSGGVQYQYAHCTKCQNKVLQRKIEIPPYMEDAIRQHSIKPIEKFSKKDNKRRKSEGF